jgi:inosine/xanthosine triphosphate pyrophosphatase family protein
LPRVVNFALKTVEVEGILRLAETTDRVCEFRHSLAYDGGGNGMPIAFSDIVRGTIAPSMCGVFDPTYHWSKLVTIFIPDGETTTLGEMSFDEYQYWSEHHDSGNRYYDHFLNWYRHLAPMGGDSD